MIHLFIAVLYVAITIFSINNRKKKTTKSRDRRHENDDHFPMDTVSLKSMKISRAELELPIRKMQGI